MPRKPSIAPRPAPRRVTELAIEKIEIRGRVTAGVTLSVAFLEHTCYETTGPVETDTPELHIEACDDDGFRFEGENGRNQPAIFACKDHRAIRALADLLLVLAEKVEA